MITGRKIQMTTAQQNRHVTASRYELGATEHKLFSAIGRSSRTEIGFSEERSTLVSLCSVNVLANILVLGNKNSQNYESVGAHSNRIPEECQWQAA